MRRLLRFAIALGAAIAAAATARAQADAPLKFNCVVRDAQILSDRTHVRCANKGMNGLSEFAAETNQPYASRVAAAIVQALRTGTTLVLTYAPAPELNPEGCSARNCRKIIDVGGTGRVPPPPPPPLPANSPPPQVQPADFDPVDAVEEDDGPAVEMAAPAPAAALDPQPMQPIAD